MKIDMKKAYDQAEWCYLDAFMRKMCFPANWMKLAMMLVTMLGSVFSRHNDTSINGETHILACFVSSL